MTYAEYVEQLLRFLMREGDVELEQDADFYIRMAEDRLSRDLRQTQRMQNAQGVETVVDNDFALPAHIYRLKSVRRSDDLTPFYLKTLDEIHRRMRANPPVLMPVFGMVGRTLRFVGPLPSGGLDFLFDYAANVPRFKDTDTSWLADEALDLYNAAVFAQVLVGMKSDQRKAMADSMYSSALSSFIADDVSSSWPVNPLPTMLPYGVS